MIYKICFFNHIYCEKQTWLFSSDTEVLEDDPRLRILFKEQFDEDRPHVIFSWIEKLDIPKIEDIKI